MRQVCPESGYQIGWLATPRPKWKFGMDNFDFRLPEDSLPRSLQVKIFGHWPQKMKISHTQLGIHFRISHHPPLLPPPPPPPGKDSLPLNPPNFLRTQNWQKWKFLMDDLDDCCRGDSAAISLSLVAVVPLTFAGSEFKLSFMCLCIALSQISSILVS